MMLQHAREGGTCLPGWYAILGNADLMTFSLHKNALLWCNDFSLVKMKLSQNSSASCSS